MFVLLIFYYNQSIVCAKHVVSILTGLDGIGDVIPLFCHYNLDGDFKRAASLVSALHVREGECLVGSLMDLTCQ